MKITYITPSKNDETYKSWLFFQLENVPSFVYRNDIKFIDNSSDIKEFLVRNKNLVYCWSVDDAINNALNIINKLDNTGLNILDNEYRRLKFIYLNYINFLSVSMALYDNIIPVNNITKNKVLIFLTQATSEHNLNGITIECSDNERFSLNSLNINHVKFKNITAQNSEIASPYLKKSILKNCLFNKSSIFSGKFEACEILNNNFESSSLLFSHFSDSIISECNFSKVNFYCTFFYYCHITSCDFSFSEFNSADFRDCNISMTDFTNANLKGADFSYTTLSGVNFTDANLDDADFTAATIDDKTIFP
ncbi:pentapeptide repeat-containing protein [Pectobacterium actinidiae]|uniref:pentapeptide repeat-containing protein n=1 Tax=Pectobacterium actinidiae TaxID=1507808 RepID=UPI0023AA7544|nr:pentapeptide repeat-containing protein [Pectobacterium actinidiae]WEF10969.1 pentapeptide repeat-containing protein [Pectobacterium actinidiae]